MLASLPMYDWPEVRTATDIWWQGLARHMGISGDLQRSPDHATLWSDENLLFSQTCGYPFTHEFKGLLRYVSTPHYGVEGCEAASYCSFIFARELQPLAHFRGAVAAVNNSDSMSGMLALKLVFGPLAQQGKFFGSAILSGGHVNSMLAVGSGKADICAIDAVCVAMARRYRPDYLEGLVEVGRSPLVPGLPYVTRAGDMDVMRHALVAAFADGSLHDAREQLFLAGQSVHRPNAYERITQLEHELEKAGGLALL